MYRIYLRRLDGQAIGESTHPATAAAAKAAFAAMINQTQYDGFALAAVLTERNRVLAIHRFDRAPGDAQFWRGRLDQLPFSSLH